MPGQLIKRMVLRAVLFLNAYTDKQGISDEYSPRELILRWPLHWKRHCKYQFGAYGQTYNEPDTNKTNTLQPRSRNVICAGPTGNPQGSYYFLDLDTKALIKRRRFIELPMPDSMIKRVKSWGRIDKQNELLRFYNRNNEPFDWSDEQEILIEDNAPEPEPATYPDIPAETPGVTLESNVPAVITPSPMSEKQQMAAALENAGIAGEFEEFQYRGRREGNQQRHRQDVHVTHNHFNLIPAEAKKIAPPQDQDEDSLPAMEEDDDSSGDETYVDEEMEDIELVYNESENEQLDNDSPDTQFQETRSGRRVRPPEQY